jgi:hypothetical protein
MVIVRMGNDNGSGGPISLTLAEDIWYRINRLSCAVGIDARDGTDEFGIYPNPVTDRLVFTGNAISTGTPLIVMNAMGQHVQQLTVNTDHSVDVSHLRSGVYFLRMEHDNETRTVRFVKE